MNRAAAAALIGGRRNGRSQWARWNVEAQALLGEHVHAVGSSGTWCVTRQPIGFLWARMPSRGRGSAPA